MTLFLIIIIVVLVALSALFSATETAITASSIGKIHKFKNDGDGRAKLAIKILRSRGKVISAMLIANTLVNIISTTTATALFIDLVNDQHLGAIIASIVMSFTIIVFAEAIPKAIAVILAERILLFEAYIIAVFLKIFGPINFVLNILVTLVCKLFKINLNAQVSGTDEVRGIIQHQHHEGNVYQADREMLEGVLDIRDISISEIMIHRSDITSINLDKFNSEVFQTILSKSYTRIPVWQEKQDNIVGMIHIRDLFQTLAENSYDFSKVDIKSIITKPWFVPDHVTAIEQLNAFKQRNNHFACVIDEYGDLQGIITLEDILEEIVGKIYDEHDQLSPNISRQSDSSFIIDGSTTIRDINKELDWNLPDEEANTIAGFIINHIQTIPKQNEEITIDDMTFFILKKINNKIKSVRVQIIKKASD
ncbi:MAG: HlyC/CorC family transporter [Rickettsiaceae bacterium]